MPESACLHIQDRESGPIRVMDLPWIAVRIGRSAACEVRLHDPEVPGEACRLQRRGRTWRLIPLGRKGSVFLQGEPVHEACLLPFDVPFRVGSTCFTLRPDRAAEPNWGMYHAPAPARTTPAAATTPEPQQPPPPPAATPEPPRVATTSPSADPSANVAPAVNPWEARWRAAGARLLAQGAGRRTPPPSHTHPSPPRTGRVPTAPTPTPRAAEPPSRPDLRAGFTTHPLGTPTARGYPTAPAVPPRGDEFDHRPRRAEFRQVPPTPTRRAPAEPAGAPRPEPEPAPPIEAVPVVEAVPPIEAMPVVEAVPPIEADPIIEAVPVVEAGPLVVAEFEEVADVIARFATETSDGARAAVEQALPTDPDAEEDDGDLWLLDEAASAYDGTFAVGDLRPAVDPNREGEAAAEPAQGDDAPESSSPCEPILSALAPPVIPLTDEAGPARQEPRPPDDDEEKSPGLGLLQGEALLTAEAIAPFPQPSPAEGGDGAAADEVASTPEVVPIDPDEPPAPEIADDAQAEFVDLTAALSAFDHAWSPYWIMGQAAEFTTQTSWPEPIAEAGHGPVVISPSVAPPIAEAEAVTSTGVRTATLLEPPRRPRRATRPHPQHRDREPRRFARPDPEPTRSPALDGGPDREPERIHEAASDHQPAGFAEPSPAQELDLPSAKDILASAPRRPAARATAAANATEPPVRLARPPQREHVAPTVSREPAAWSLPAWLAGPPIVLLALTLGIPGAFLAARWAGDSNNAAIIGQRLLAARTGRARERPLPETVTPSPASWWQTTPLHLAEWGVYRSRPGATEDEREEAGELLDRAVQLSPLHPVARLARAEVRPASSSTAAGLRSVRNLGLSRDPASLSWSARNLRLAGKKPAAVRLYRRAFLLADGQEPSGRAEPAFNAEPSGHRYYLPGEIAATAIVRDLLADADWPCREWIEAIPPAGVAALAAARLLHDQGKPEAREILDRILAAQPAEPVASRDRDRDRDDEPTPDGEAEDRDGDRDQGGYPAAIRLAVAAEAHALLEHWGEAEARYRRAIDLAEDVTTRRAWWFNLASLASRGNDEPQRKAALEAALEVSSADDIGRRAVEMQRASEPMARSRLGIARGN
ncbi:FHA domain-containing protein [Aquisphaera insulae]|uniref:FHA domain-containing protein n=1 Tax=Aquisphaera insulae TaxID=2712864 RepID=UPI0013EA6D44|nr:FHA domain-containing protein [Aquisphaera insulae]